LKLIISHQGSVHDDLILVNNLTFCDRTEFGAYVWLTEGWALKAGISDVMTIMFAHNDLISYNFLSGSLTEYSLMKTAPECPPAPISSTDKLSINFVWIPAEKIPSGKLPIPNTENAPFIANMKKWKVLNPNTSVNLYIQKSIIKESDDDDFFDAQSLINLQTDLGSQIHIKIMDKTFYQDNLDVLSNMLKQREENIIYRSQYIATNIFEESFFIYRDDINKHPFDLYQRVDFARLIVLAHELRTEKSNFAIYVDADIMLNQTIESICNASQENVLFWYLPNNSNSGYFIENQLMGFRKDALDDLDTLLAQTAHVLLQKKNGYEALRFYSEELRTNSLKLYASQRSPKRIDKMLDEIKQTILNGTVKQKDSISVSTDLLLESNDEKRGVEMKLRCCIIDAEKFFMDVDDLKCIIAFLKIFTSQSEIVLERKQKNEIPAGLPYELLTQDQDAINNYLFDLLPSDYRNIFEQNLKKCNITGDEQAVKRFKNEFLVEKQPLSHPILVKSKVNVKIALPTAHKIDRAHSVFYIWFTTNPSDPLGKDVNWRRIKNWRAVHPASEYNLSIVVAKSLLNDAGKETLETLKNTYNITIVDVCDVQANNPVESFLLDVAKNEIQKGGACEGDPVGHFALASDMLRFMRYLLQNYGIYSDMDGFMNLQSLEDNVLDAISFFMPTNNSCLWVKNIHHPAIDVFQQLQYCNLLLESAYSYRIRHATDRVEPKDLRRTVVFLTGLVGLFDGRDEDGDPVEKDHIGMWNKYARELFSTTFCRRLFQHDDDWTNISDNDFELLSVSSTKKTSLGDLKSCQERFSSGKRFVDIMCDAITVIDANPGLSTEELTSIKTSIFKHPQATVQYEYVLWFAAYLQQKQCLTQDEEQIATNSALDYLTLSTRVCGYDHPLRLFSAAATYLKTLNFYCLDNINVDNVTKKWEKMDLEQRYSNKNRLAYCQWALLLRIQYQYATTPEQKEDITAALDRLQRHKFSHQNSPRFGLPLDTEEIQDLLKNGPSDEGLNEIAPGSVSIPSVPGELLDESKSASSETHMGTIEKNNSMAGNPTEAESKQVLTKKELCGIRRILTQYQSHSWQAFFWNTMCCGVFGKHYSQTLYALQTLVGDGTTAVRVTHDQILEAINTEPKYAAHRQSLFNEPKRENSHSGTDEVIYNVATILNKK
jgi:hypothetical protein